MLKAIPCNCLNACQQPGPLQLLLSCSWAWPQHSQLCLYLQKFHATSMFNLLAPVTTACCPGPSPLKLEVLLRIDPFSGENRFFLELFLVCVCWHFQVGSSCSALSGTYGAMRGHTATFPSSPEVSRQSSPFSPPFRVFQCLFVLLCLEFSSCKDEDWEECGYCILVRQICF